jgi:DNA-binding NtrC family response regulator
MIMLLHSGKTIRMSHVENELEIKSQKPLPFKNEKDTFLKKYIEDLLNFCGGKIPKAAQLAGTTRESFYRLMRENLKKNLK